MKITVRKVATLTLLIITSGTLWFLHSLYPNVYLQRVTSTAIALTLLYFIFRFILEQIIVVRLRTAKTRYALRKVLTILYGLLFLAIAAAIWLENVQALSVAYGLLAAGIAIALQDLVKNLAGGIILFLGRIYSVGDRIEADGKYGDVMDIGILYTTLLELREWIAGDQPTGRLTIVPNGYVLSGSLHNYTKDHSFIWDEISIPITYDSDWKEAAKKILEIVDKQTRNTTEQAEKEIQKIEEKYYLPRKTIEPAIFMTLTDNWITFNIRYVTDVRERRAAHSRLTQIILEEIQKSDTIQIGSETIDITTFPELTVREKNEAGEKLHARKSQRTGKD